MRSISRKSKPARNRGRRASGVPGVAASSLARSRSFSGESADASSDGYEREAEAAAASVMRMPAGSIEPDGRQPGRMRLLPWDSAGPALRCQEAERALPAALGIGSGVDPLRGRGVPLPASARGFFEPRFGRSFADVRIHAGSRAAAAARALHANAFTVGRDVVFGAGRFTPDSFGGKRLLAHELAHVVQQTSAPDSSALRQRPSIQRQPTRGVSPCVCPTGIRSDTTLTCDCSRAIRIERNNVTLDCAGHTITGANRGHGILLRRRSGVTVKNCNITKFSNGVALRRATGNTLTAIKSFDNVRDGFDLNASSENSLTGNTATGHTASNGIELDDCNKNSLLRNTVSGNEDGIDLNQSDENVIEGNTASKNTRDGYRINRNSDGNRLTKNAANDNGRDGFRIDGGSDNNAFTGNTASKNASDALDVGVGDGNTCKGNSFTHPRCPEP